MANTFRDKHVEEGVGDTLRKPNEASNGSTTGNNTATPPENNTARNSRKPRHRGRAGRIFGGEILRSSWLSRQGWLIALIALYGIILVSNRYHIESLAKEKKETEQQIRKINEQRLLMRREYQKAVRISNIVEQLDSIGVGIIAGPPCEIQVEQ